MKVSLSLVAVSVVASTAVALLTEEKRRSPDTPPDPVESFDFADPAAVFDKASGMYYAFGNSQAMASKDLTSWTKRWQYLDSSPAWAPENALVGAPGAPVLVNGEWMMTFQAELANCKRRVCTCIGAAFRREPLTVGATFRPADRPLECAPELDGAIDSSPRVLDGRVLVYYKTTGVPSKGIPSQLWVSEMEEDGSLGGAVTLLNQTEEWEHDDKTGAGCTEAPAMFALGGSIASPHLLFYSGGDWTAGLDGKPYSIGLARCDTAFGPCTKLTTDETGPWFGPHYNGTVGPGSNEIFLDAAGEPWIVFHGWEKGRAGYDHGGERRVRFYPLREGGGMPRLPM